MLCESLTELSWFMGTWRSSMVTDDERGRAGAASSQCLPKPRLTVHSCSGSPFLCRSRVTCELAAKTEWHSQRPATVAALEHTRTLQERSLWRCFGEICWSQKYNGVTRVIVELSQRLPSKKLVTQTLFGVNNVQLCIAFLLHIFF